MNKLIWMTIYVFAFIAIYSHRLKQKYVAVGYAFAFLSIVVCRFH